MQSLSTTRRSFHAVLVDKFRRGVAWPLVAVRLVFGWPYSEGLQKVRVIAVQDFIWVKRVSAHRTQLAMFSRQKRGRTSFPPSAYDRGGPCQNFFSILFKGLETTLSSP
jgi:hypothetical protein